MKRKKAKNNYKVIARLTVLAIVISSIAGVTLLGKAQMAKSDIVELTELANSLGGNVQAFQAGIAFLTGGNTEEAVLGSSGDYNLSSFTAKAIQTEGITIDGPAYFDNTTTPSVNTDYGIVDSLDLTGTSTAKGATQNVIAYYTNTGADLLVSWAGIDISTALVAFEASMQCGTSTWVGGIEGVSLTTTSSSSIIATTTIASTYTTTVNGTVLDTHGTYGTGLADNKIVFPLKNAEVFFCTWTPYGATSTESFSGTGSSFTGVGNMLGTSHSRGN